MKQDHVLEVAEPYKEDLRKAIDILKEAGCDEVFLFGSLASQGARQESDIDLAVRGCPPGEFFHLLGKLLMELDHSVDLVNLDSQHAFAKFLEQEEELVRIA